MEFEALQTYEQWGTVHERELYVVEQYWENRAELVTALKEGAVSSWPNGNDGGSEEEEKKSKAPILDPTNPDVNGKWPTPPKS